MIQPTQLLCLSVAAIALSASANAPGENSSGPQATPEVVWKWHEPDIEISGISFSRDSNKIVFSKRLSSSGSMASKPHKILFSKCPHVLDNPMRREDPNIVAMNLRNMSCGFIGFGWDPSFSPNGKEIVFAAQVKPLLGLRILADTIAGNEIRIANLESGVEKTLAKPNVGHFSDPKFNDTGDRVYFSIGEKFDSGYPTTTDIAAIELDSPNYLRIYTTEQIGKFREQIGEVNTQGKLPLVRRCRPITQSGTHLAEKYSCDLISIGSQVKSIHKFGDLKLGEVSSVKFFKLNDGRIVHHSRVDISDKNGRILGQKGHWGFVGGKVIALKPKSEISTSWPGAISPDGKYIFQAISQEEFSKYGNIVIRRRVSGEIIKRFRFASVISEYAWSNDSKYLAIVASHYADEIRQVFQNDEIILIKF